MDFIRFFFKNKRREAIFLRIKPGGLAGAGRGNILPIWRLLAGQKSHLKR
jgi:hypothetical protein